MKIGKRHQTRISCPRPNGFIRAGERQVRRAQIDTKREKQRHCSRKAAKNAEERQKRNLATEECKGKILRFMNYDLGIMNYENFLNNCEIYE